MPTGVLQPTLEGNHGLDSALATIPDLAAQAAVPNSNIITKLNQNSSVKRPGIQKPVVERAPRSLFMFTLDNKFRKW